MGDDIKRKTQLIQSMTNNGRECIKKCQALAHYYNGMSYSELMLISKPELEMVVEFVKESVFENDSLT